MSLGGEIRIDRMIEQHRKEREEDEAKIKTQCGRDISDRMKYTRERNQEKIDNPHSLREPSQ